MEEELRAILRGSAALVALVDGRVNWGERPQGAPYPAIVLHNISGRSELSMNTRSGLNQGRVQVDCWGETYQSAKAVARAVKAELHGYRAGGFLLIQHDGERDDRAGGSNEVARPYRTSLDFLTSWRA